MRPSTWLPFWGSVIAFHSIFSQSQTLFSSDSLLTNIAVDNTNGNVYLGGANVIVKLTSDLKVLQSVTTGPEEDNANCWPPQILSSCKDTRIQTDNFNKILILYEQKNQLIACGSIYQGFCELRNLSSLSLMVKPTGYFIASSNTQPAVGMLAPSGNGALKFYVGATWEKSDKFSKAIGRYVFISRDTVIQRNRRFEIYEVGDGKQGLEMTEDAKDTWEMQFKHTFSSANFSYFVFSIGEKLKAKHSSISRVCQKDGSYDSYVQIPLHCNSTTGTSYNLVQSVFVSKAGVLLAANLGIKQDEDVLFAVFAKSTSAISHVPTKQSAVCVYSVKDINKMFRTNIERCINGLTKMGLPWLDRFGGNKPCVPEDISNHDCISQDINVLRNKRLGGDKAMTASPVLEYNKSILTSVVAIAVGDFTAIFVGTGNGDLLKVSVKEKNKVHTPNEEMNVVPSSRVHKMAFSKAKQFVFAVADKKVVKIPVQECKKYKTCDTCAGKGDAFCGWCTLENRCTVKSDCSKNNLDLRFVQTRDKCVKFSSISPDRVPREQVTELVLTMENLPALTAQQTYKCYIHGKEQVTVVALPIIKCTTPAAADLPPITADTGDVKVELALKSSETGAKFAMTDVAFFNCDRVSDCLACTEGPYVCNWCVYKGKCSAGTSTCNVDDILVKAKQNRTAGEPLCPQLTANQELLVPSNVPTTFAVKGNHLPRTKAGFAYHCSVNVGGAVQTAAAEWNSDTQLTCKDVKFSYTQATQNHPPTKLHVLWHKKDKIGNPHNVSVSLFKCDVGRESCSVCWVSERKLKCGWCRSEDSCTVKRACAEPSKWTNYPQPCNIRPKITKFWPMAGPTKGGTEIEIIGRELGKQFEDIRNTVLVAGFQCKPDLAKYEVSLRIFCNTTDTRQTKRTPGPIYVTVDNLLGRSDQDFVFQNPVLRDFFPKKSPESGGSLINITGEYLDTGRYISAYLAGVPCSFDRKDVTQTSLLCRTNPSSKRITKRAVNSGKVVLVFDGHKPPSPPGDFVFTPDPSVFGISPPKTFVSGGQTLTISGDNFDSIQQPKMFFKRGDGSSSTSAEEECQRVSSTEILCRSPNASALGVVPFSSNGSEVCVGFIMDDVKKLLNCSMFLGIAADPDFLSFSGPDKIREQKDDQLILKGRNLDIITKSDVRVTVQNTNCNITDLEKELLICLVPKEENLQITDNARYPVTVYVGNLVFKIGQLEYFRISLETDKTMYFIIAGAVGAVLLLFIVILVCYNRRKQKKQKKKVDNIARELETLESKVARECREAFAELQTDVTDLTSDLITLGMPYLEFRYYALRVLFPNQEDHPVLHEKEGYAGHNWEAGLRQFTQLINNKNFLLVFIRTLEAQTSFNMRDRCDVASLLMVALQGRMEYATEILRQLLCELIKKSVAKSHPKLLLRRTESVAEKMLSDWLAFCMYNFLKQEAGEPLFVLFKAIKRQVEKGPVDAVTGEGRYSLSEDRLLRQTVEFKKVSVTVEYDDSDPEDVVLLDCDSISQAKEKILDAIYKNKPYSGRLGRDTLQLEWLHPGGRVRPLRDDDNSSEVDGEWRRINTLSHYKITDNNKLRLTAQQTCFYSPVSISESSFNRSMPSLGYTPTSYTPLAQSDAALEQGGRTWHLVKQMDYPTEKEEAGQGKMLSEIYLTRLLSTKGTLQQFVDRLFKTVFSASRQGSRFPLAIKFLFDLLDDQARELKLEDEEVLHMWKNNSLPLRFWINIIKNPNFIFDIEKSGIVDSCLSVIAQLFMDSCSVSVDTLGTDSPSNKLLYAREIPDYNERVKRFYRDISELARPTSEEMSDYFADMSMQYSNAFNVDNALKELFVYAKKYQEKLQDAFEECGQSSLATKLEHCVIATIDDENS